MSKTDKLFNRKLLLGLSVLANLGLLFYFKYSDFIIQNLNRIGWRLSSGFETIELLNVILPVGISFYTFQTLSYSIDVYKGEVKAEKNLFKFALYVCYFPQLVAGPIERFGYLKNQLFKSNHFSKENFSYGFRYILLGFFVKMVVADNLAPQIDQVYTSISETHSFNLLYAMLAYSFQIYCDFHGYSLIAIGVSRLFGIQLTHNFKTPYFSYSITSFWRRWHITLTNWFRDYVYYPIGGNKNGRLKMYLGILIVFVLSGVWHGANWTFVLWGILHGAWVIFEKMILKNYHPKNTVLKLFSAIVVFTLVSVLWVFFRSPDFNVVVDFFQGIFKNYNKEFKVPSIEPLIWLVSFLLFDFFTRNKDFAKTFDQLHLLIRWTIYFILMFAVLSRSGLDIKPFIYFQF